MGIGDLKLVLYTQYALILLSYNMCPGRLKMQTADLQIYKHANIWTYKHASVQT